MKAAVLAFVSAIAGGQEDAATVERYYRDAVFDLGRKAHITNMTVSAVTAGQINFTLPTDAIEILDVAFDDRMLDPIRDEEGKDVLEWIDRNWRDRKGMPIAWVPDDDAVRTVRFFPTPDIPSKGFIPNFGEPAGRDFPGYSCVLFHTERRDDVALLLESVAAFRVLSREVSP